MNSTDRGDQRRFRRFRSGLTIRYRRQDGGQVTAFSRIVDVSEGGLRFASREMVSPDTILEMDVGGSHDQRPVLLHAKVIWAHPTPDLGGHYYSGVSFLDRHLDARALILDEIKLVF